MVQTIDLSAYKKLFLQTAREQVDIIRNGLLMIRLNPEDTESLKKIHISAHSLKGQALAMGYEKTAVYCRLIEYVFRDALDKKIQMKPEIINCLKDSMIEVEGSIDSIEQNGKEIDLIEKEKELGKMCGIKVPDVN